MATEAKSGYSAKFSGRRILIVEDEYFLADETRRQLQNLGAAVIGPTGRVDEALALIAHETIDAAILDVQFAGEYVFPVAEKLEELKIPYVFASAYNPAIIPARFKGFILSEKPIDLDHIARALFGRRRKDV
jgi:CheY-like chemotaxis protein